MFVFKFIFSTNHKHTNLLKNAKNYFVYFSIFSPDSRLTDFVLYNHLVIHFFQYQVFIGTLYRIADRFAP